ncbi:hypothetical protein [Listeria costaricensis]|uniref:hypothetical protein n=1 Tax=Listeria costaricensis TaxID=2026604 RepID=UPI000C06A893|nr:hypothetical protein [Listeria costaricensis]
MADWKQQLGVYGVYMEKGKIFSVLRKEEGPFQNKYDLPGGTLLENEMLVDALKRHMYRFDTEAETAAQLGSYDFLIGYGKAQIIHQIALVFQLKLYFAREKEIPLIFETPAEKPAEFVMLPLEKITEASATPLLNLIKTLYEDAR